MYIKNIEIRNFRNIEYIKTDFNKKYNILCGENAQGKTNFLEAISLTLNGLSHREKNIENFIKHDADFTSVNANIIKNNDIQTNASILINTKKIHKINANKITSRTELLNEYNIVLFTPDDLKIVKGYPSDRRRFLNESISLLYPAYHTALRKYNKTLRQRNALLKEYGFKNSVSSMLDIYDETLCELGCNIITTRMNTLKKLEVITNKLNTEVCDNETISFFYSSNVVRKKEDVKNLKTIYWRLLKNSRNEDIYRKRTTIGPQYDDINIFINTLDTKKFASQGQQRSIAVSMKLSLIELLYRKFDEYPIVLLDDVMSDLDSYRQEQIIKLIGNTQSFITCVDYSFMKDIEDYGLYKIKNGKLMEGISG